MVNLNRRYSKPISVLLLTLLYNQSIWAVQGTDPTTCKPLGECLTLCQQHQGNVYADFAIPGKDCICPACNTLMRR